MEDNREVGTGRQCLETRKEPTGQCCSRKIPDRQRRTEGHFSGVKDGDTNTRFENVYRKTDKE